MLTAFEWTTVEAAIKAAAKLTGTKSKDGRDIIREGRETGPRTRPLQLFRRRLR